MHQHQIERATKALEKMADALTGSGSPAGGATKQDLNQMEARIMTAISDYAAKMKPFLDQVSSGIDGLAVDIQTLNDKITALQNSPGPISAEDQTTLDGMQADGAALAARITTLDDLTPPPVPTP